MVPLLGATRSTATYFNRTPSPTAVSLSLIIQLSLDFSASVVSGERGVEGQELSFRFLNKFEKKKKMKNYHPDTWIVILLQWKLFIPFSRD